VGNAPLMRLVELSRPAADPLKQVLEGRRIVHNPRRSGEMAPLHLFDNGELHDGLILPLQLERVTGVMLVGTVGRTIWSESRMALGQLWASQAAAILGDEAVHEQMRDALSVQEKLARRRELMLNVIGEIYQAGTVEQTLGRIAQLSPQALGVEACIVALRTRREGELEIAAATGELGVKYLGVRLALSGEQLVRVLKADSVAVLQPHEMEAAGFGKIKQSWLAGLAVVPMLHSEGRPIGCMALMSAGQVAFTSDQLELAKILASRASAAIENAHLNGQIRREAETRAMLLRELNHRVKNNLAGIVGLLAMSSNMEMPARVRQWLDRVIERIGNIARAHEMFSGGIQAVSLSQLVDQVIPSLAVVKPPGVTIVKELGPSEIWLKTTQAVSLAMVIHELCYNAIVHGLGARGTLTIKAKANEKTVAMDIIDDGTAGTPQQPEDDGMGGLATMAPPASSTGLGLRLVKGLVGRELRGRFVMRRRNEGGTIVSIEFPLERERE
jgi:two-component sensor histidine kinase